MPLQPGTVRMTTGELMMTQGESRAANEPRKQKSTRLLAQIARKTIAVFRATT
jgi:hypothetical protein